MNNFVRLNRDVVVNIELIAAITHVGPQKVSDEELAVIAKASADPQTGKIDPSKLRESIARREAEVGSYVVTMADGSKFSAEWIDIPSCFSIREGNI